MGPEFDARYLGVVQLRGTNWAGAYQRTRAGIAPSVASGAARSRQAGSSPREEGSDQPASSSLRQENEQGDQK